MAETNGEEALDQQRSSHQLSKRNPDVESSAEEGAPVEAKKRRPEGSPDRLPREEAGSEGGRKHPKEEQEEEQEAVVVEEEVKYDSVHSNGEAAVASLNKGKGVVAALDKGKGKMVAEDDRGDGTDDDDSDDDGGVVVGEEEYESDLLDDPLAEVDLSSILPYRTRGRDSPPPESYLVNDLDDEDDDDAVSD